MSSFYEFQGTFVGTFPTQLLIWWRLFETCWIFLSLQIKQPLQEDVEINSKCSTQTGKLQSSGKDKAMGFPRYNLCYEDFCNRYKCMRDMKVIIFRYKCMRDMKVRGFSACTDKITLLRKSGLTLRHIILSVQAGWSDEMLIPVWTSLLTKDKSWSSFQGEAHHPSSPLLSQLLFAVVIMMIRSRGSTGTEPRQPAGSSKAGDSCEVPREGASCAQSYRLADVTHFAPSLRL